MNEPLTGVPGCSIDVSIYPQPVPGLRTAISLSSLVPPELADDEGYVRMVRHDIDGQAANTLWAFISESPAPVIVGPVKKSHIVYRNNGVRIDLWVPVHVTEEVTE